MAKPSRPLATRIYRFFIPKNFRGEFKKGAAMGADFRGRALHKATGRRAEKASSWLKTRGREKSEEWIAQRKRRFKRRLVIATAVIVVPWGTFSWQSGIPAWLTALGVLGIALTAWQIHGWVIKQIEKGRAEK